MIRNNKNIISIKISINRIKRTKHNIEEIKSLNKRVDILNGIIELDVIKVNKLNETLQSLNKILFHLENV